MLPDLDKLQAAYAVTRAVTQQTPLLDCDALALASGAARVFVKPESLQWAGSFKIRGAFWRLTRLTPDERSRGVIAYSSGNFAQGLAAAGQRLGVPVTIVMPDDAPLAKRMATEAYGAKVILSHHGSTPREEAASALARELAAREGLVLLHPFDDAEIVVGQAAAGLEALEQMQQRGAIADSVLCCVGGGGLLAGVALAFHHLSPASQIFAVEPEGYDGMGRSLAAAHVMRVTSGQGTICDALQATAPGAAPYEVAAATGVKGLSVGDDAVRAAMRFAFERLKLVLEPSGAVALAALLAGGLDLRGQSVLVYATGGNISLEAFFEHMHAAAGPVAGETV